MATQVHFKYHRGPHIKKAGPITTLPKMLERCWAKRLYNVTFATLDRTLTHSATWLSSANLLSARIGIFALFRSSCPAPRSMCSQDYDSSAYPLLSADQNQNVSFLSWFSLLYQPVWKCTWRLSLTVKIPLSAFEFLQKAPSPINVLPIRSVVAGSARGNTVLTMI